MITAFLLKTLIFLGTLSILVVLHEWGHFIVARLCGVRVLEFSFGMGRLLCQKVFRGVSYQFRLFPIGGYVKMAGEQADEREKRDPLPDEFLGVSAFRRLLIVLAGPAMNLILTFVAFFIVLKIDGETLTKPIIGYLASNSVALKAGMQSGDEIIAINNEKIDSLEKVFERISSIPNQKVTLQIRRNTLEKNIECVVEQSIEKDLLGEDKVLGRLGIRPFSRPIIFETITGSPAEKIGIQAGDLIIEIDGVEIKFFDELQAIIEKKPEEVVQLKWKRGEEVFDGSVKTDKFEIESPLNNVEKKFVGRIGVQFKMDESFVFHRSLSFHRSIMLSFKSIVVMTELTFRSLVKIFQGMIKKDQLAGPIRIAGMITKSAEHGWKTWLQMLAFISLQLAIINLFPIPALDGGHALFCILEIIRSPIKQSLQDRMTYYGFALLLLLMFFVIANDVFFYVSGFFKS